MPIASGYVVTVVKAQLQNNPNEKVEPKYEHDMSHLSVSLSRRIIADQITDMVQYRNIGITLSLFEQVDSAKTISIIIIKSSRLVREKQFHSPHYRV